MHDRIVPLILTLNEEPNLGRVLSKLTWARSVVVLDSYSNDSTQAIANEFPNVLFRQRVFDVLANQWNAGLESAARRGEWVLALDADYVLSDELIDELGSLRPDTDVAGYEAHFVYCVDGVPLKASLYPPHTVLFRARLAHFVQDGHAQRLTLKNAVRPLVHPIFHDDRKSWSRWYSNQQGYACLEAEKIKKWSWFALPISGKVRRLPLVSVVVSPVYLLFYKGLWRDGRRGLKYIWQRLVAEWLIQKSLWVMARR